MVGKKTGLSGAAGDETPWGPALSAAVLCPGVVAYSTERHGGFSVSEEALAGMPDLLRACTTFAGPGWYEEDVDVGIVVLAFSEHFTDMEVWSVVRSMTVSKCHPNAVRFVESAAGEQVRRRAASFVEAKGHLYQRGGMSSSGGAWTVNFYRISDGKAATGRNLSDEEAFGSGPVDLKAFGDRVTFK